MLWLTRSGSESEQAKQLFESAGYQAIAQSIYRLDATELTAAQRTQILSLDNYDGVIFISKMAARSGIDAFAGYWPQYPARQVWCAMGESSAAELMNSGQTIVVADPPNSEGLLAQLSLEQLAGQKWLIVRGNGGRELLKTELEAAGACVDYLELYRRENLLTKAVTELLINQPLSGIVVASTQAIDQISTSFKGSQAIFTLPIVVPGERAASKAKAAGFSSVIEASSANDHELLKAWKQYKEDIDD